MSAGRETWIEAVGGTRLRRLDWSRPGSRARLLVVHGLGEHAGRYESLAEEMLARGYSVTAYDQRGHGRSEGRRGDVERFSAFTDDLVLVERTVAGERGSEGPLLLYGHSMGGLVVLLHARKGLAADGIVLSAPWLATALQIPRWKQRLADILRHVRPSLPIPKGLDPARLSRDKTVQRAYAEDPYVVRRLSVRFFDAVEEAQALALETDPPDVPLLVLLPEADPVTDVSVTARWARRAAEVTVETFEGMRHEPHNELGRGAVFDRVARWIETSWPTSAAAS